MRADSASLGTRTRSRKKPAKARPGELYERLRDQIVSGELAAGLHLVETALAEANEVSRTPVREALRRLEQDGLVERFERGLRVRLQGPEEILDLYEVRIVLESAVTRAAAERYREIDRIRLVTLVERMREVSAGDVETMAEIVHSFHRMLWQASQNPTYTEVLNRLAVHLHRYPTSTFADLTRWPSALAEHEELLDAVLARDGDRAAQLAIAHMTAARDVRISMWGHGQVFAAL